VIKVAQVKDGRVRAAALAKEVKVDVADPGHLIP
jgi:hypothetical protein